MRMPPGIAYRAPMIVPPPHAGAAAPRAGLVRLLRYGYRLPLLLWHLLIDLPLVLLAITPLSAHWRLRSGERLDHRLIRAW